MQLLHPHYNKPGDSVDPHFSVSLRFLCRQSELTLLFVSSAQTLLCSPSLNCSVLNRLLSTTWGQCIAKKARVVCPRGALSITKWKFKFNICISLILLNWFKSAFYQCKYHANLLQLGNTVLKP